MSAIHDLSTADQETLASSDAPENKIYFEAQAGVDISFEFDDQYIVTKGKRFQGVESSENCLVVVRAERKNSSPCADWFSAFVNGDEKKMIHTKSRGNKPKELNFALKGKLTINGDIFDVCFGQGHQNSIGNNWHFCAPAMIADKNGKNGHLSSKYYFAQSGTHKFLVTLES